MVNRLADPAQLQEILEGVRAVIYKHSTRCSISSYARAEVELFAEQHPEWKVYRLDVVENRPLSDRVARAWGVRHESPQVLIVNGASLVWHGSHFDVTAANLEEQVA